MTKITTAHDLSAARHIEVDAARLLLILDRFAIEIGDAVRQLRCMPAHPVVRYFTPEYRLQKLDFLVRYPAYFAYELIELHTMDEPVAADRTQIMHIVRMLLSDREPERRTDHYQKFLRGAYECLDTVEAWWHSRNLVYRGQERRGGLESGIRPQKYYFLTVEGENLAKTLVANVDHAQWYHERICLIHTYFGSFTTSKLKTLQYAHLSYRAAQIAEEIPDLNLAELSAAFERTFAEPLGVDLEI